MKKLLYSAILFNFLMVSTGNAEVDYRVYSEDYTNCLKEKETGEHRDKCAQEEYYRIRKNLEDIQRKIQQVSQFEKQNKSKDSLLKNINNMEQYGFLYCEYMQAASEKQDSFAECLMQQINFLYVDLYKLHQEIMKK